MESVYEDFKFFQQINMYDYVSCSQQLSGMLLSICYFLEWYCTLTILRFGLTRGRFWPFIL